MMKKYMKKKKKKKKKMLDHMQGMIWLICPYMMMITF
jgi:hypothetical protein